MPPTKKADNENLADVTIEKKLVALYSLQQVDSEINKIRIVRGELPLEVQDLEDEIEGLETRIENVNNEVKEIENDIKVKKAAIKEHQSQIKKYEAQQMNVRNNREYDSITKEIEFQTLEIQLCEKKIKEFTTALELKTESAEKTILLHKERKEDLTQKKVELEEIVSETEKEEKKLVDKLQESQKYIEERLITAYQRIKKNARNGLAVVMVERDACGGCFNKIPPQRQLDIKMHKKIIVCEYCGRILVDSTIDEAVRGPK
ncbi:MAG: C4-type zinc ribbon domain-containing protein [Bacteroidota bacterium]